MPANRGSGSDSGGSGGSHVGRGGGDSKGLRRSENVEGSSIPKRKRTVSKQTMSKPMITGRSDIEEERREKKKKREKGKRKLGESDSDVEEEESAENEGEELDFGGNIDLDGVIKKGDPNLGGFISVKAKNFMDVYNPDKVRLGSSSLDTSIPHIPEAPEQDVKNADL